MKLARLLALVLAAIAAPLAAQHPPSAAPAHAPDYAQPDTWLCLPGRADACSAPQDATIVAATGRQSVEAFKPASAPQFDCFYVYPTVSLDPTPNADLKPGLEEKAVAAFQAARFAKHCRVFAPLYRQITLAGLRRLGTTTAATADRALAYGDVKAAWAHYLATENKGRGVVLIGHSQGSGMLKQLIAEEIDGKPAAAARIISAMLIGTNIAVPKGKDTGGDFKAFPLCRKATQTSCLITYVSFRAETTPPDNSRFGVVASPGMVAACTNPAALGGGKALTDNYLGTRGAGLGSGIQAPWVKDGPAVTTPFVKAPGLISTECVQNGKFSYLAVAVNADPADPRTDTIAGDITVLNKVLADWGLHLIDMPVVMGNLVELTNTQAKAWAAKQR